MVSLAVISLVAAPIWRGVDASFLPQYADLGVKFFERDKEAEPLALMAKHGINLLRLRVWVNPKDGYCSVERTLEMAKKATAVGMELMIDFHYSDWWADPGHQVVPAAWKNMSDAQICTAVAEHTSTVLKRLNEQGTPARFVQIGNEVRDGMIWPMGRISNGKHDAFASILKAGVRAARSTMGRRPLTVIIHDDEGGNLAGTTWFYGELIKRGVSFDAIGLSYYPWWHGSLSKLKENLDGLAAQFKKPVMVVETAYPFTLESADDEGNFVKDTKGLVADAPPTPAGQVEFLHRVNAIVASVPNKLGLGTIYWAPEYVAAKGVKTPYENLCLFDFDHRALPGLDALGH